MDLAKRKTCANCQLPLRADARNAWHQQYCKEPACRAASKTASQQCWCAKPENRDYFRGPDNVARVPEPARGRRLVDAYAHRGYVEAALVVGFYRMVATDIHATGLQPETTDVVGD